ncbi:MAG TPA: GGDEF domain-containing protein, partial [Flexistipes sinusarabici]|nr:GGDEF domain-containing protein [Flexistipes sinusarabici]
GVALWDIDHFKNINDQYGHDVGDMVLIKLTEAIQNSVRKSDIIGRFGGEEFICIFPGQ